MYKVWTSCGCKLCMARAYLDDSLLSDSLSCWEGNFDNKQFNSLSELVYLSFLFFSFQMGKNILFLSINLKVMVTGFLACGHFFP